MRDWLNEANRSPGNLSYTQATFGFSNWYYNYSQQAAALVHIYTDGSVLVSHGGCEIGQGLYTKMIQVRKVSIISTVEDYHTVQAV